MDRYRTVRRGFVASDEEELSPAALHVLRRAAEEVSFLVDRAYPRDSAIGFVGDRHQLTERQRLLLARAVSGELARKKRQSRELDLKGLAGRTVLIDGFNLIITLEVALSGSPVVIGQDGTVRDLAGLRGTYHLIDKTPVAIDLVFDALEAHGAAGAHFLFDLPVSNSGRISGLVRELGEPRHLEVDSDTIEGVDKKLSASEYVVTSDSAILDSCTSWFNLGAEIVERLEDCWTIDLFGANGTATL
ncbi:MAG: DUF434 domain-containing protein [Coriobacteriales bacterium]